MPKLSEQTRADRRRHVLDSALRCFARQGFHATTMDEVIAETGWSSSVVYRYARGKDDLIAASVQETLTQLTSLTADLLGRDPRPTPPEAVRAVADLMDDAKHERAYNLSGLVIQTWAEALRRPDPSGGHALQVWSGVRRDLATLVADWQRRELVPPSLTPGDVASLLALLINGIVVDQTHHQGVATDGVLHLMASYGRA